MGESDGQGPGWRATPPPKQAPYGASKGYVQPVRNKIKTFLHGYGRKVPVRDPRSVPPRDPPWLRRPPEPPPKRDWYTKKRIVLPALFALLIVAGNANGRSDDPDVATSAVATPSPTPTYTQATLQPQRSFPAAPPPVYTFTTQAPYANCAEAIASGMAPIVLNEPGFSPALDIEGGNPEDGVACEGDPIPGLNLYDPIHYENCDEVREAGVGPLTPDDPGYSRDLDREGDGIACEWT